ncbi:MAG: sensor histidine kinase [Renibacterium salmoninarum]|nr:sensor histidine kinase [Renibacterium salmoninarum]
MFKASSAPGLAAREHGLPLWVAPLVCFLFLSPSWLAYVDFLTADPTSYLNGTYDHPALILSLFPPSLVELVLAGVSSILLLFRVKYPYFSAIAIISAMVPLLVLPEISIFAYGPLAVIIGTSVLNLNRIFGWGMAVASGLIPVISAALIQPVSPWNILQATFVLVLFFTSAATAQFRRSDSEFQAELLERQKSQQQRRDSELRLEIARDVHDILAHTLSSIHVQAGVGSHFLHRDLTKTQESLTLITMASKSGLDEVRLALGVFRGEIGPDTAQAMPGLNGLPELVESFEKHGLKVTLDLEPAGSLSLTISSAIYRICQEALTNVLRHAQASTVVVSLKSQVDNYILEITDNGQGFVNTARPGRGITGMRERAEQLHGQVKIMENLPHGVHIRVSFPKNPTQESRDS